MTEIYISTRSVRATPMTRLEYDIYRGWDLPEDEDGDDAGFMLESFDIGVRNVPGHAGYISWLPKAVFDKSHHKSGEMTFGEALHLLKEGHLMARSGWNGKGMWISYSPGHPNLPANDIWTDAIRAVAVANGGEVCISPYINMKTAAGDIQTGWLASQSDMLSSDWCIVTQPV